MNKSGFGGERNNFDLMEQAFESSIPKIIVFIFILILETIVVFIVDKIFGTCTKKKRKVNYSVQNYSSFSTSITTVNFDSLGKDFDKNTDSDTLLKRISVLKTEHSKYDCPSTFAFSAKISREINRLNQILDSRDSTEEKSGNNFDLSSYLINYIKDLFTINTFAKIVFKIINVIFLWVCRDLIVYVPSNSISSEFFKESEYANYLEVKLVFMLVGINLIHSKIEKFFSDILSIFCKN